MTLACPVSSISAIDGAGEVLIAKVGFAPGEVGDCEFVSGLPNIGRLDPDGKPLLCVSLISDFDAAIFHILDKHSFEYPWIMRCIRKTKGALLASLLYGDTHCSKLRFGDDKPIYLSMAISCLVNGSLILPGGVAEQFAKLYCIRLSNPELLTCNGKTPLTMLVDEIVNVLNQSSVPVGNCPNNSRVYVSAGRDGFVSIGDLGATY